MNYTGSSGKLADCWQSGCLFKHKHRSCIEDDMVLSVTCGCALSDRLGVDGGRGQKFSMFNFNVKILKSKMRSPRRRLHSSDKRLSLRILASYDTWGRPRTTRVVRRWILSSVSLLALNVGALASIAYSRCDRIRRSTIMTDSHYSVKDRRSMKCNRFAVFVVSL